MLDGDYWYRNLRHTVRFAEVIQTLVTAGHRVFVEVSPHPVLTMAVEQAGADLVVTGTLRRDDGGRDRWLRSVASVHVAGVAVDWTAAVGARRWRRGWRCRRMRSSISGSGRSRPRGGRVTSARWGCVPADHPLLGAAVSLADGDGVLLTGRLSLSVQPWLADHAVFGSVLLPGTAFVELAVYAGDQVGCGLVEELTLQTPLVLPEQGGVQVQVWVGDPDEGGRRPVNVYSRMEGAEGSWTRHATGVLSARGRPGPGRVGGVAAGRCAAGGGGWPV